MVAHFLYLDAHFHANIGIHRSEGFHERDIWFLGTSDQGSARCPELFKEIVFPITSVRFLTLIFRPPPPQDLERWIHLSEDPDVTMCKLTGSGSGPSPTFWKGKITFPWALFEKDFNPPRTLPPRWVRNLTEVMGKTNSWETAVAPRAAAPPPRGRPAPGAPRPPARNSYGSI